jgi:hypothetical protein
MSAPTREELAGGFYAAGVAQQDLEGASTALHLLADVIDATPENEAAETCAAWACAIRFIARSLHQTETFIEGWLKPSRDEAAAPEVAGP